MKTNVSIIGYFIKPQEGEYRGLFILKGRVKAPEYGRYITLQEVEVSKNPGSNRRTVRRSITKGTVRYAKIFREEIELNDFGELLCGDTIVRRAAPSPGIAARVHEYLEDRIRNGMGQAILKSLKPLNERSIRGRTSRRCFLGDYKTFGESREIFSAKERIVVSPADWGQKTFEEARYEGRFIE